MTPASHIGLQEAADRLGVHYMTAYRYVRTGRLAATRVGGEWQVDPRDVAALQQAPPKRKAARPRSRAAASARLEARLCARDEAGAWRVVEEMLEWGTEPVDILMDLLGPAMGRIGARWEAGELSVADEHGATTVAHRIVARLGPKFARRGRKRGTIVIGAPSGERHSLPLALASDVLRASGYDVVDLGADTPAASFAEIALNTTGLRAVVITATTKGRVREIREAIRAIRATGVQVPILVGGGSASEGPGARRSGADTWTVGDARELVRVLEELTSRS
jgi:excisionase family DNA binding protein